MALKLWSVLSARMAMRLNSLSTDGAPLLLIVADQWTKTCNLSSVLIPYVDGSPLQVFFADFLIGSLASICSAFRCGRTGPLAKMVSATPVPNSA
ncbi:hypothetical protein ACFHWW_20875, partial [Ensifer sp. P24N7]|uniref:hypothetical protein n=1 Tax=Sinorhizobium sp. P24N7 TaxID=3348358 RepID=UPI0035F4AC32